MYPQLLALVLIPILASAASIIPQQHSGIQSYRVKVELNFFTNFGIYFLNFEKENLEFAFF